MLRWLATFAALFIAACGGGQGGPEPVLVRKEPVEIAADTLAISAGSEWPEPAAAEQSGSRTAIADELVWAVTGNDPNAVLDAIDALSHFPEEDGVIALLQQASLSPSAEVRAAVVDALADIGTEQAILALTFALSDPVFDVREEAVQALDEIGSVAAHDLLTQALADEDPEIRQLAAGALGTNR